MAKAQEVSNESMSNSLTLTTIIAHTKHNKKLSFIFI